MTWSTLLITPLGFVFPDLRNQTRNYEWFVDAAWCAEIILSFLKANKTKKTLGSTSWQYLFNGRFYVGAFWFDVASTLPPMLLKEENLVINALHFLRFYHFQEIFYPIETVTNFILHN